MRLTVTELLLPNPRPPSGALGWQSMSAFGGRAQPVSATPLVVYPQGFRTPRSSAPNACIVFLIEINLRLFRFVVIFCLSEGLL